MSSIYRASSDEAKIAIAKLFEESAPILVEVRFPGAATAPDWHLIHEEDAFDSLVEALAPNVELSLSSVWNITNPRGPLCVRK